MQIATALLVSSHDEVKLLLPSGHEESISPMAAAGLATCLVQELSRYGVPIFVVLERTARGVHKAYGPPAGSDR